MPTYTYLREDGEKIEVVQKMSDEKLIECPDTGQSVKLIPSWQGQSFIMGWSPDNERRKKQNQRKHDAIAHRNPGYTTLPDYQEKINENTKKAKAKKLKKSTKK